MRYIRAFPFTSLLFKQNNRFQLITMHTETFFDTAEKEKLSLILLINIPSL